MKWESFLARSAVLTQPRTETAPIAVCFDQEEHRLPIFGTDEVIQASEARYDELLAVQSPGWLQWEILFNVSRS